MTLLLMIAIEAAAAAEPSVTPDAAAGDRDAELRADMVKLSGHKVLFGHHSVGENVLDGVHELERRVAQRVWIDSAPIGNNGAPLSKIADFERRAIASKADIVVMKLCFVDIVPDTDVDAILAAYVAAVARIRSARPGVVVVHVTPPLHARDTSAKARIKRALGVAQWTDDANVKRAVFARKLIAAFPGEPLFDLAAAESTLPDGTRALSAASSKSEGAVPELWSGYTDDGGHLNPQGKVAAARAFIAALAAAVSDGK